MLTTFLAALEYLVSPVAQIHLQTWQEASSLVQVDPVVEQPPVMPLFAKARYVRVLGYLTRHGAFLKTTYFHGAKLVGEDATFPQHTVGVWCEVDRCAGLVGQAGLLENLRGNASPSAASKWWPFRRRSWRQRGQPTANDNDAKESWRAVNFGS